MALACRAEELGVALEGAAGRAEMGNRGRALLLLTEPEPSEAASSRAGEAPVPAAAAAAASAPAAPHTELSRKGEERLKGGSDALLLLLLLTAAAAAAALTAEPAALEKLRLERKVSMPLKGSSSATGGRAGSPS